MRVPQHIAIIMDGNGRWAKTKGLPRTFGHKEGVRRVKEIVKEMKQLGVKILTVFAFSTENWIRSKGEIHFLFTYLDYFLKSYKKELLKENIRFRVIGRRDRMDKKIVKRIENVEESTKDNKSFTFNVAIDYGGRWDILQAMKKIINQCSNKTMTTDDINEKLFKDYLSLGDLPDPDLLIRTSGEERISNFLLWELAYSEFYFPKTYWPDFTAQELKKAIDVYASRQRRFGGA